MESCALAQARLAFDALQSISEDILPLIGIIWVEEPTHTVAMAALLASRRRKLSLVDCVGFAVIREKGAYAAFAFDKHFAEERFVFPGESRPMG